MTITITGGSSGLHCHCGNEIGNTDAACVIMIFLALPRAFHTPIIKSTLITTWPIYLRARDCKYRESLARLKISKILIICQKNPFGELSSKKIFSTSKNL